MTGLLDLLEWFNRKERFFLVGEALGNPRFRLSAEFRAKVAAEMGIEVPADAFAAMDYHLDWLAVSLHLATAGVDGTAPCANAAGLVTGNQEDVDLLVAFAEPASSRATYIILIEAKVESPWTNTQMESKAERLRGIFGHDGRKHAGVSPNFMLMSPSRPQRLRVSDWPAWMTREGKVPWLPLTAFTGRRRVTRCTPDGRPAEDGSHFRVRTKNG